MLRKCCLAFLTVFTVTIRNPILEGNYADPSVVRYGSDYYMTTTQKWAWYFITTVHTMPASTSVTRAYRKLFYR